MNSRISTIYVLAQYKPESLIKHVATAWSPWFADGEGTIKVLLPRSNTLGGQFKGTADAVYQYLDLLQAHSPDVVAVFAADHVYRMDVRQMVASHCERKADVTVAAVACRSGRRRASASSPPRRTAACANSARSRATRRRCRRIRRAPTPRWETTFSTRCCSAARERGARARPISAATSCRAYARATGLRLRLRREPRAGRAGPRGTRLLARRRHPGRARGRAAGRDGESAALQPLEPPLADPRRRRCRRRARAQPLKSPAPWQAASRDRHSDERLPTS